MTNTPNPDKRRGQRGKDAEKAVEAWLNATSNANWRFCYHRYPDARAARGALAAQPADFLVSQIFEGWLFGKVTHLEVKETEQKYSLHRTKIGQFGKLRMFWLAGIQVRVIVHRTTIGDWVVLTDAELFASTEVVPSFSLKTLKSYPSHEAILEEIFK